MVKARKPVSAETRRKMSEAHKARWRKIHAAQAAQSRPVLHVNYGHAAHSSEEGDECIYCGKRFAVMAYTYFGAPVCGRHWDGKWRKTEDGACDPPFMAIKRQTRCEWL